MNTTHRFSGRGLAVETRLGVFRAELARSGKAGGGGGR